jgi:hypothetical protein
MASLALQRRLAAAPSVAGAARAMARRAGPGVQQAVAVLLLLQQLQLLLLPAALSQVLVRVRLHIALKPVVFWSLGTTLSIPARRGVEGGRRDEIGVIFGYNLDTLVLPRLGPLGRAGRHVQPRGGRVGRTRARAS